MTDEVEQCCRAQEPCCLELLKPSRREERSAKNSRAAFDATRMTTCRGRDEMMLADERVNSSYTAHQLLTLRLRISTVRSCASNTDT
jgi:hypothetical protein